MLGKEVRQRIEELFAGALLGPGSASEVLSAQASDTYLTGILWPRGTEMSADEDDSGSAETADGDDTSPVDAAVPGYRAIRPCSVGITFETEVEATLEVSLGSTARYRQVAARASQHPSASGEESPEGLIDSSSREELEWQRAPLNYRLLICSDESRVQWRTNEFLDAEGRICIDPGVSLDVNRRHLGDRLVVTITLINTGPEVPVRMREATLLFQAEIRVTSMMNGRPAIHPRKAYPFSDDEDHLINLLL